jgi:predicted TIM-barrel fold metal-dependent hydrolase
MRHDTIDIHTHVFNLRYLPLEGIVRSRLPKWVVGRKAIAAGLARLLNALTHDGSDLGAPPPVARPESAERIASADAMLLELAAETPRELRSHPDVAKGIAAAQVNEATAPTAPATATAGTNESVPIADGIVTLLSKLKLVNVEGLFETVDDFINWITFLRKDELFIMKRLFDTYPVDLYVHHMMDMEPHYDPGTCYYEFNAEQIRRMRRLVELSGGKLMTFVAWSPDRDPQERLEIVKEMVLSGGAGGVKVYPPSGYAANDARNEELWEFCVAEDVPVFTHCNASGFYANKKFIEFNDPKYWAKVLDKHPQLRLCFGHAGGEAGWFDRYSKKKNAVEKSWETSFAKQVFDLCTAYPNVYCETGFLPEVLDNAKPFVDRLTACVLAQPSFAHKIMYGTDWHMLERFEQHTRYFEACQGVFAQPVLSQYKDLFFYANAVDYLNLPAFEARQSTSESFDVGAVAPRLRVVQEKAETMKSRLR